MPNHEQQSPKYGIPAVAGVPGVTERITGSRISVNGTAGTVVIEQRIDA